MEENVSLVNHKVDIVIDIDALFLENLAYCRQRIIGSNDLDGRMVFQVSLDSFFSVHVSMYTE